MLSLGGLFISGYIDLFKSMIPVAGNWEFRDIPSLILLYLLLITLLR